MNLDAALSKLRPADPRGSIYQECYEYDSDDDNNRSNSKPKHEVTKKIKKFGFRKKKYKSITDEMREQLIDAIQNEGLKIKHAAKKLRMNYSSAKSIFKIYKREGRLNKKIFKRRADHQGDDQSEGTPMSEDLESVESCHESRSGKGIKEESSASEGIQDQASLKILIPVQENSASSPLLKREEVQETSVDSFKEHKEVLKPSTKISEESLKQPCPQPNTNQALLHQKQMNFYSMDEIMKQNPYLFADNSSKVPANSNYLNALHQQPIFPAKLQGPFPPSAFLPKMDPLNALGQSAPKALHFTGFGMQQSMDQMSQMMVANKMNPFLTNPYVTNLNQLEPFINYSLLNNFNNYPPLRMNNYSSKK